MAKLWDIFDGEPFLTNPRLGILGLNPRGKKGQKMAARKKTYRRKRTTRRRRNAYPVAGVALNPRRRRKTYRRRRRTAMASNPRRRRRSVSVRRRRMFRRNPSMFGGLLGGLPTIQTVLFTGVGFVGTPIVEGFANRFIPATITSNTIGKYAVRIASVIGVTFLVKTLIGSAEARPVAVGGGLYVATTAFAEFAPGVVPGLSGFAPGIVPGLAAYTRPATRQLSAYAAPNRSQLRGNLAIAPRAATMVPSRFRRI